MTAAVDDRPHALPRVPGLDGLRGLAIVAVLAFHSGYRVARGGFLGVSLFFTISGYLITTLLVDEHERGGRVDLLRFWERRFRRLAPAAIVTLAGVMIAAHHFADRSQRAALRGDVASALGYVANWRFLAHGQSYTDLFRAPSPVLHFWSLAIEEQFYLAFPIVVAVVMARSRSPRRALLVTLFALSAISIGSQLTVHGFDRVYYGTDTRLFEIVAGAILATLTYRNRAWFARLGAFATVLGVGGFAIFATLVVTTRLGSSWLAHGGLALVALVNVALVVSVLAPGPWARALSFRPLVAIGRVSYGLYLVHWPVFLWLDEQRTGYTGIALLAARLAVVVPVTVASYHLLECPIRFRRRFRTRSRFVTTFAAGVTAVAVLVVAFPGTAVPSLTDPTVLASALAHRGGPMRVLVVGDSTGTAIERGLVAAHDPRITVADATAPSCPVLHAPYTRYYAGDRSRPTSHCADQLRGWVARAHRFRPDLVLVVASVEETADHAVAPAGPWADLRLLGFYGDIVKQYENVARAMRSTGAVVAWANAPEYTFAGHPEVRARGAVDERVRLLNAVITQVATEQLGVVTLDLASHLDRRDGTIDLTVRPDGVHYSPAAALHAADTWLGSALLAAHTDAEHELGVDVDSTNALRVLVAGDSTSLAIAAGLGNHGRAHGDMIVDWAGQIACPLTHAFVLRSLVDGQVVGVSKCKAFAALLLQHLRSFRPDVVLVVSSLIDASDLHFAAGWEHVGEPRYDQRYQSVMRAAINEMRGAGVPVLWANAPREQLPAATATRVLNARLADLDRIVASAIARTRGARVVDFAAHIDRVGGGVDLTARPDGVHFTVAAATRIADSWLAAVVVAARNPAH